MSDERDWNGRRTEQGGGPSGGGYTGSGHSGGTGPSWGGSYGDAGSSFQDQWSARDRAAGGGMGGGYGAGSRVLDDIARLFTDAAGAAQGVRREVETAFRTQAEGILGRMDVVRRDEFEAMAELASRARSECDELRARVDALEARLAELTDTSAR